MKTLQEKKDCILSKLRKYQNEFKKQIESLEAISNDKEFENLFIELSTMLALCNKQLLAKMHMCLNDKEPDEIENINI